MKRLIALSPLARWSIRSRLAALVLLLITVVASIIVLSSQSAGDQQQRALVDNIAGRQPVLAQRYLKEVLLVSEGFTADPASTADVLIRTGDALLDGGKVLAVQGNDREVTIQGASDSTVRAKLAEELRLDHQLVDLGSTILTERAGSPAFKADVTQAEILTDVTANVGHDAVGRMSLIADRAVATNSRIQMGLATAGIALALGFAFLLSRLIVRRLRRLAEVVTARAQGDTTRRFDTSGNDEITALSRALNEQADHLDGVHARLAAGAEWDGFAKKLVEAFEMAEDETEAYQVVQRSMTAIAPEAPMELLLADSSQAHLERLAISPTAGAPGCGVESPYSCVAVRRANPVVFSSSEDLNACPRLLDRPDGPCSAVCTPVSFMGKSLGVLHVTGPDNAPPDADQVAQLNTLAGQVGARIGTLRVFEQTQLQANTDGLTGLMNRRNFENKARALLSARRPFALAMADLDHFKILNDTYGHDAGDRALRLFAETVRSGSRGDDLICRYGGEEFALLLPGADAATAASRLGQIQQLLDDATSSGKTPTFTVTIGVTDTSSADTLDELIKIADRALYKGKHEGRNRVVTAPTIGATVTVPSQPAADPELATD